MSIALWQSKSLVFKLPEKELRKLPNDLFSCIQFDKQLLTSDIPEHRLQFHLEKGLAEKEAQNREEATKPIRFVST
uniref:hypothetical protein n=1 Tax=Vibrio cholerae TaxID=666 RepID=UPI003F58C640